MALSWETEIVSPSGAKVKFDLHGMHKEWGTGPTLHRAGQGHLRTATRGTERTEAHAEICWPTDGPFMEKPPPLAQPHEAQHPHSTCDGDGDHGQRRGCVDTVHGKSLREESGAEDKPGVHLPPHKAQQEATGSGFEKKKKTKVNGWDKALKILATSLKEHRSAVRSSIPREAGALCLGSSMSPFGLLLFPSTMLTQEDPVMTQVAVGPGALHSCAPALSLGRGSQGAAFSCRNALASWSSFIIIILIVSTIWETWPLWVSVSSWEQPVDEHVLPTPAPQSPQCEEMWIAERLETGFHGGLEKVVTAETGRWPCAVSEPTGLGTGCSPLLALPMPGARLSYDSEVRSGPEPGGRGRERGVLLPAYSLAFWVWL